MNKHINIVVVLRSGGDFTFQDVSLIITYIRNKWESKIPYQITCLNDRFETEQSLMGVTMKPFPVKAWKGWWSKMNLFSPELEDLRPFLYMDLDTAIISDVSKLIPNTEVLQNSFITLEDFYSPRHLASGVMWIPNGFKTNKIWNEWMRYNSNGKQKRFRGDQDFIRAVTSADTFWQRLTDTIVSFKPLPRPIRWRTEKPSTSTLCCFHGNPRIHKAAETVDWVKKYVRYED